MDDCHNWLQGVTRIAEEYGNLSAETKRLIGAEIANLLSAKLELHALVEAADGGAVCASCGGQCCMCGKYHFSAIDCVAYLSTGKKLFDPDFSGNVCPFLNVDRCKMSPEYRPFNCITFACEPIEASFSPRAKDMFYAYEKDLRQLYAKLQQLFPNPRMRRSVLTFLQEQ